MNQDELDQVDMTYEEMEESGAWTLSQTEDDLKPEE